MTDKQIARVIPHAGKKLLLNIVGEEKLGSYDCAFIRPIY